MQQSQQFRALEKIPLDELLTHIQRRVESAYDDGYNDGLAQQGSIHVCDDCGMEYTDVAEFVRHECS